MIRYKVSFDFAARSGVHQVIRLTVNLIFVFFYFFWEPAEDRLECFVVKNREEWRATNLFLSAKRPNC